MESSWVGSRNRTLQLLLPVVPKVCRSGGIRYDGGAGGFFQGLGRGWRGVCCMQVRPKESSSVTSQPSLPDYICHSDFPPGPGDPVTACTHRPAAILLTLGFRG